MSNPDIILGPPGTGKTTTLLSAVEERMQSGTPPDRIGYVSFTRRAAEEAISRAAEKFGAPRASFPYFRTLHSLCYRRLGLRSSDVMDEKRLREFADWVGVRITGRWSDDGNFVGFDVGDRMLFMENLSRLRCVSLREQYDEGDDNLAWEEIQRFSTALKAFKAQHGIMDYTDMLSEFVRSPAACPQLEHLFVDEAQDLSPLQWRVVDRLAEHTTGWTVAGDDDQAIYRWAGASVDHLVDLEGQVRVLGQSYRVPPAVQALAANIIGGVLHRREKEWRPRTGSQGSVVQVPDFSQADCSSGEVLVLARNVYVLGEHVEPELRRQGIIYEKNGYPSVRQTYLQAVLDWETLRRGNGITVDAARGVYAHMSSGLRVRRGYKELPGMPGDNTVGMGDLRERGGLLTDAIWHVALDRLPRDDVDYMVAALRRGEKLRRRPRVRLATIHGSKGGQADHVVLLKDMAARTYREMEKQPDDEARVWYVGVTRAFEQLTVVEAQTNLSSPYV